MPEQQHVYGTNDDRLARLNGPIHGYFGLSYANYLVLRRSLLQSMPVEWQERFVACLGELSEAFAGVEGLDADLEVLVLSRPRDFITVYESCEHCEDGVLNDDDCPHCGGLGEEESTADHRYETAEEVGTRSDPIPNYDRGRTYIAPAEKYAAFDPDDSTKGSEGV